MKPLAFPFPSPSQDVWLEPGLWVVEERLRARINLQYLAFRAQRRREGSVLRVPSLRPVRGIRAWSSAMREALDLFRAAARGEVQIYRVARDRGGSNVDGMSLRCTSCLVGKQNTLCFGWTRAPKPEAVVYKVCRSRAQFEREVRARKALRGYFRVPTYAADASRLVFRERFVGGCLLADAPDDLQEAAIEELIEAYTQLTASHPIGPRPGATPSRRLMQHAPLQEALGIHLHVLLQAEQAAAHGAAHARVLCHNDLSGSNVIVSDRSVPFLIDFERAAPNLFFADVLWLIADLAMRSKPHCLRELLRGRFDLRLRALWQAAGREYTSRNLPAHLLDAICSKTLLDVETLGLDCWSAKTLGQRVGLVAGMT